MREETVKNKIRLMVESQATGVLATVMDQQPYASLVAFSYSPDLKKIFFATPNNTTKYRNLTGNPNISLIIDSRICNPKDFSRSAAITVMGEAHELAGDDRSRKLMDHAARLPGLAGFFDSPAMAMFQIDVQAYIVADGLTEVAVYHP
jgi:heme iron utilization protein